MTAPTLGTEASSPPAPEAKTMLEEVYRRMDENPSLCLELLLLLELLHLIEKDPLSTLEILLKRTDSAKS